MINQYNDSSVLDYFHLDALDIGGDPCYVQIVLTYDIDSDYYTVERFNDRKSWTHEEFDDKSQASACFDLWVKRAKRDDAENRADAQAI